MLELNYHVDRLRPAAYNPRAISPDAIDALRASIRDIGFCKPIIVKDNDLIIAGHQRTKAAKAEGLSYVPAFIVSGHMGPEDEVLFNQMHNGTDLDDINIEVRIAGTGEKEGPFENCPPESVIAEFEAARGATLRASMASLVLKFGPWGCTVVDPDGLVIGGPHYALVCRQLGIPVRVFRLSAAGAQRAREAFARQYGEYSYGHLAKAPYIQSYAQPSRNDRTIPMLSKQYRRWALPELQKGARLLDFGCGKGRHVRKLQKAGFRVLGIEFFPRIEGRDALDTVGAHMAIDGALKDVAKNGRYDIVLNDFVVNSVQTLEAEADVLHCVNAFCKPGGMMLISGRSIAHIKRAENDLRAGGATPTKGIKFYVDKDGFGGELRRGQWFYQRFHNREEVEGYGDRYGYDGDYWSVYDDDQWFSRGTKTRDLDPKRTEDALLREFNLAWPNDRTVGKGEQAVAAWKAALALEAK